MRAVAACDQQDQSLQPSQICSEGEAHEGLSLTGRMALFLIAAGMILRAMGRSSRGDGDREADRLRVTEGGDSQGVLPGVGQPWVSVRSRGRRHSWHRANEALKHQCWDPIAVCSWASWTSVCLSPPHL